MSNHNLSTKAGQLHFNIGTGNKTCDAGGSTRLTLGAGPLTVRA
jgi:hypothetical protein